MNATQDSLASLEAVLADGRLADVVSSEQFGTELKQTAHTLIGVQERFERLTALAELVPLAGPYVDPTGRKAIDEVTGQLILAGQRIEAASDRDALKAIRYDLGPAGDSVKRLDDELKRAWTARIEAEFRSFSRLEQVLAKCQLDANLTGRIRQVAKAGLDLAGHFPPTKVERDALPNLLKKRDDLRDDLTEAGASKAVVDFLLAAVDGRATLVDAPPVVWQWLEGQGALKLFKIQLA